MPELPEVQALAEHLDRSLRGRTVARTHLRSIAALKTYDPPLSALDGASVAGASRRGKFVVIDVDDLHLVVHLARAGWLRVREKPTNARPSLTGPLALAVLFDDGSALEATEQGTDKRLAVYVVRAPDDVPGIARLGVDALDPALDATRLAELVHGERSTLKSVLADQSVIAGIGNAYSDEVLHAARLSPFRRAESLQPVEREALITAIRDVLGDALMRARAAEPDSLRNDKKIRMRVHGRTGDTCPVCGGVIREVSLASRSFQYCPTCQTGGRVYADRRMSRLLR